MRIQNIKTGAIAEGEIKGVVFLGEITNVNFGEQLYELGAPAKISIFVIDTEETKRAEAKWIHLPNAIELHELALKKLEEVLSLIDRVNIATGEIESGDEKEELIIAMRKICEKAAISHEDLDPENYS